MEQSVSGTHEAKPSSTVSENSISQNRLDVAQFKLSSPKLKVKQTSVTKFFTPRVSDTNLNNMENPSMNDNSLFYNKSEENLLKKLNSDTFLQSQDIQTLTDLVDLQTTNESENTNLVEIEQQINDPNVISNERKRRRISSTELVSTPVEQNKPEVCASDSNFSNLSQVINKVSDDMRNIRIQVNLDSNGKTVCFQNEKRAEKEFDLPEEGLILVRQLRGAMLTKARHIERRDHLQRLLEKNITPPWAINNDTWPHQFFTTTDKSMFCDLQRRHATERLELFRDLVDKRINSDESRVNAFARTLGTFCIENDIEDEYKKASGYLDKQFNTEKSKQREMFDKRENDWRQNEPTFDMLWKGLTARAKDDSYSNARDRSRSRSRSRSPAQRAGRASSPYRGRGRGRGANRGRGSFYRGRSNYRGYGQNNRRGNYGRRGHGNAHEVTNLTNDEVAVVLALRENKTQ